MDGAFRQRLARRLALRPVYAALLALALLLISLVLALQNEHMSRVERVHQITVQADILAGSVAAPLAFDDSATAQEYINALRANPDIEAAGAYGADGRLSAGFTRDAPLPRANTVAPPTISHGELIVTQPVTQSGTNLGSVYLRAALEPWTRRASRYVGIAIVVVLASLLIAVLGAFYGAATDANRRLREEIDARHLAEEALRQSQKMEAMGQLTGGVAHDFNNLLMAASSGLELMDRTTDPARLAKLREGIRHALDRGAKLTQQLLTFARRSPLKPEVIDVAQRIGALRVLLDRSLREDIAVRMALPDDLWPVKVDPSQFEVALLNVAVNARDAMPNGGEICIRAANVPAEGPDGQDWVDICISDEGQGMPPDLIDKVFEPFFTTKGVGHGTGLGLSQVYGFARAAGGSVRIDSEEGVGTTVTLQLPRSATGPARRDDGDAPAATTAPPRTRVLLAEDDDGVAEMTREMLGELGYDVARAASAADALEMLDDGIAVDALLSDMVMPGEMGGLELAHEVRDRRPTLPVVLMTGYSAAAASASEEGIRLLTKPFGLDALAAALAEGIAVTKRA